MPLYGDKKRAYQREWMRRRRQEWIQANGPCAECGSDVNLEVDHIDPATKKLNPRAVWSLSKTQREAELAKCQVLCEACHLAKTAAYFSHSYKGKPGTPLKLTWEIVERIRHRVALGHTRRAVGEEFGIHHSTVTQIVQRKIWASPPKRKAAA